MGSLLKAKERVRFLELEYFFFLFINCCVGPSRTGLQLKDLKKYKKRGVKVEGLNFLLFFLRTPKKKMH